jgi:hypothetical protein
MRSISTVEPSKTSIDSLSVPDFLGFPGYITYPV